MDKVDGTVTATVKVAFSQYGLGEVGKVQFTQDSPPFNGSVETNGILYVLDEKGRMVRVK